MIPQHQEPESFDLEYLKLLELSLSEWNSAEDNEAYNDL
jgi:hypothetical protein